MYVWRFACSLFLACGLCSQTVDQSLPGRAQKHGFQFLSADITLPKNQRLAAKVWKQMGVYRPFCFSTGSICCVDGVDTARTGLRTPRSTPEFRENVLVRGVWVRGTHGDARLT